MKCAQKQGGQVAHGGPCDVTDIGVCSVDRVGRDVRLQNRITAVDLTRGIDPKSNIALINIGTATRNDLKIIPGLSPQAITITTEENDKGDFSSIGNFGKTRVLAGWRRFVGGQSRNRSELFQGIGPKVPGLKCAAGGDSCEAAGINKPLPRYAGGEPLKL